MAEDAPLKVIAATDGSEAALAAVHRAVGLLRPGAAVSLVMVIAGQEDPMADAGGFEGPVITEDQAAEEFQEASQAATEALDHLAHETTEVTETRLVVDDAGPARGIVRIATEEHADLLVIGAHETGLLKRLFSGSVSDYVVHHAPCPVLVVRHDHGEG